MKHPCAIIACIPALILACLSPSGCRSDPRAFVPVAGLASAMTANSDIFEDKLPASGIVFSIHQARSPITIKESVGHGAALVDCDKDGLLDIVLLGPDRVKVYHNEGYWRFTDVTAQMGLRQSGYWQGVAVGDYDNDGYPDLFVCGYDCSALYHNEQGHAFREVTKEEGLEVGPSDKNGNPEWRTSAAFVDADQDRWLDLYVCRYAKFGPKTIQLCGPPGKQLSCAPEMYKGQTGSLFMNLGGKRFRDETTARGLQTHFGRGLGIAIADYNDDGLVDIVLANDELPGNLYQNKGRGYFRDVSADSGTAYDSSGRTHGGMGIDWGDFDNDGKLDLFVTTYENEAKNLYRNVQGSSFLDVGALAGIYKSTYPWVGWGSKFMDYDRDGRLDLFMVNGHVMDNVHILGKGSRYAQPVQLFHNEGNARYSDVSDRAGPAFREDYVGRPVCLGDLDNDGKQDLLVGSIEGKPMLLRNMCADNNHWIGLQLVGKRSNRMGIGATVRLEAGSQKRVGVCTTTGSVLSAHDPRVYFGLGSNTIVQGITIRWPSGQTDTFTNIPADRYLIATEGAKAIAAAPYGTQISQAPKTLTSR